MKNVEQNWRNRGFSCDIWTDPPGQRWENFTHDVDELLMVIEGDIEMEMNGNTFRAMPGEEVLIPAGVTHSVRNVGQITSHWYYGYRQQAQ